MNHCVPDFQLQMYDDDGYPIPLPSASLPPKRPFLPHDAIMELFWQNGPVVLPTQNHGPLRKPPLPPKHSGDVAPSGPPTATEIEIRPSTQTENYNNQHLYMQEDEMVSRLHCPIVDDSPLDHNFCADFLYSPHNAVNNSYQINSSATMQTIGRTSQVTEFRLPSTSVAPPRPPIPPIWGPQAKIQESEHFSKHNARLESGPSISRTTARESTVVDSCDTPAVIVTSRVSDAVRSTGEPTEGVACCGSMSATGAAGPSTTTAGGGTEAMACEMAATSSPGGSTGSAEPSDTSPAEDRKRNGREADDSECPIELQVQMMSMGYGMVPMLYPGTGMNGAVIPFGMGAHMGGRSFSVPPPFHDLCRMRAATQPDNMFTFVNSSHPIHSPIPNLTHAFNQYFGPHQIQCHLMQNQTMMQQDIRKPRTSRAHENPENHQSAGE